MSEAASSVAAKTVHAAKDAPSVAASKPLAPAQPSMRRTAVKKPLAVAKKVVAKPGVKAQAQALGQTGTSKPVVNDTAKDQLPEKARPVKANKPKIIRESFWIPKNELAVVDILKTRSRKLELPAKKSELIRAGIQALVNMPDSAFLAAVKAVAVTPA